jgi:hypothetical protein
MSGKLAVYVGLWVNEIVMPAAVLNVIEIMMIFTRVPVPSSSRLRGSRRLAIVVSSVCEACARGELTAKVADFGLSWGPWFLSGQAALPQRRAAIASFLGAAHVWPAGRLGIGCTWIAACDDHDGTNLLARREIL